jgi:hypothetical protein
MTSVTPPVPGGKASLGFPEDQELCLAVWLSEHQPGQLPWRKCKPKFFRGDTVGMWNKSDILLQNASKQYYLFRMQMV